MIVYLLCGYLGYYIYQAISLQYTRLIGQEDSAGATMLFSLLNMILFISGGWFLFRMVHAGFAIVFVGSEILSTVRFMSIRRRYGDLKDRANLSMLASRVWREQCVVVSLILSSAVAFHILTGASEIIQ